MTEDPFAHLHDESYAAAFATRRATPADTVAMAGRAVQALNDWGFTPDLFDEGLRQAWYRDAADAPAAWTAPRDHDDAAAELVKVPSCWTMLRPELRHFEAAAWYTRSLVAAPGERCVLRAGAANYQALVFLNGVFSGLASWRIDAVLHRVDRAFAAR